MRLTFQDQPVHSGWFARKQRGKRQGPATPQRGYAEAKRIEAQGSRPAACGVAWSPSIVASMAETAAYGGRRPPPRTAVLAPRYNGKTRRKRSLSTRKPRRWQSRPGAVGEVSSPGEGSWRDRLGGPKGWSEPAPRRAMGGAPCVTALLPPATNGANTATHLVVGRSFQAAAVPTRKLDAGMGWPLPENDAGLENDRRMRRRSKPRFIECAPVWTMTF